MEPNRKRTRLNPENPDESVIEQAASCMRAGKMIVYPTDTTYVFGVNALDAEAIGRVFGMKNRSSGNPFHVVVADMDMAEKFVIVNDAAMKLAKKFLPGPLTLILPKRDIIPDILVSGLDTLGIRIPDNRVCLLLAQKAQFPFTTTSANISKGKNPYDVDEIIKQFGPALERVEMIVDQGPLPGLPPSTLVDLSVPKPKILRKGPITEHEITEALR